MNPIVAAHRSGQSLDAEFSHVQLFEALLWACEHNDVKLWTYLKTTPLDLHAAQELPLVTAIKHNSFDMGEQLAPLFKEHIFKVVKMFLWLRPDNTLKNPTLRARWLAMLLPNSSCANLEENLMSETVLERDYDILSYCMLVLSIEELETIPLLRFETAMALKNTHILLRNGLRWGYMLKYKGLGFADPVDKTQWFCSKFPCKGFLGSGKEFYVDSYNILFEASYTNLCFDSARIFNKHDEKHAIPCNELHKILTKYPLDVCIQALLVQPNAPYSQKNLEIIFQNVINEEYSVQITNYSDEADYAVLNALLPYLQKASMETQNRFWRFFEKTACPSIAGYIKTLKSEGANIPDIHWENHSKVHNFFEDLSKDPAPQDLNLRLKTIEQSACGNASVFSLPTERLIEPEMFQSICRSDNSVLIEKALELGARIDISIFEQICKTVKPQVKMRIFEQHLCSQVALSDIINQWNRNWGVSLGFTSNFEACYQPDVIEKLKDHAATELALRAIEKQRLDLLERVLSVETQSINIWEACVNLGESAFAKQVLECLIAHLDPWLENCQPLMIAVKKQNMYMVKRLVEVSDPRASNCEALVLASANGNFEMVRFLLNHCPAKSQNFQALHWAITYDHKDVSVMLLRESPVPTTWGKRFKDEQRSGLLQECQNIIQSEILAQELEQLGASNTKRLM